ncbi:MAG: tape measure protein [Treponema sp.]|nr:tape measure protein [Treponema sp.]MDY5757610.1 tape measure protein [Treponema sp.]
MDKKTLEIQIKLLANQALSQVKEFGADIKNAADKAKGFTGDAKGVSTSIKAMQAEAQRTANQLKLFGLTSSDLRNTTQNLKKTILDLTDSGLKPESKEVQNLVQKYKELEEQTNKAEASEQGLFGVIGKLKNEIGSLAAVAAAVKVDKAVADLAKSSLDVNNSFQKIKDDFGIMLGNVEAGIGLFNELQEFNFWTPFDIEQTSQAAKVLVSAKVPLKDLTEYLTRFGDIAQGDAQKFQSYINAFSKASAKGKADMEVLNVYTDQGVQILDALGQQLGKTSAEIVKMASEGKISFQDLDNALNALASEGGLYYGTLEKAAMRLDAVQAGLQESVKSLKASFGQMLAPAVAKVLSVFTDWIDRINNSPIAKGILAAAIATITVAVNALAVVAIVKLITNLNLASVAAAGLGAAINTALPIIGAISVVIGVVTTALVANASAHQKAADAAAEHAKKMKELDNSYKDWVKTANQADAMAAYENYSKLASSQKTTVTNLKQELEKTPQKVWVSSPSGNTSWQKDNPEYAKLKTQVKEAEDLLADYEQKRDAASRRITQAQKEDQQKLKDHAAQMIEAASKLGTEWQNKLALENAKSPIEELQFEQQQALEKLAEKASSLYDGDINKWDAYLKEKAALNEYYNKKIADETKKNAESAKKVLQDWIDKDDPIGALERQRAAAQEELAKAAIQLYGDSYKTEAKYIAANAALEMEYDEKIAAAKEKQLKDYSSKWEQLLRNIQQNLERAMSEKNLPAAAGYAAQGAALQGTQNTEAGQVAQGFANGGALGGIVAILQAFVAAIVKAIAALENGQKVLNFISTIVEKIFDVIGPLVDEALGPTVRLLELLGTTIGKLLKPLAYFAAEFAKNETFIRTISVILEGLCQLLDILFQVLKPIIDVIIQILKVFGYIANPAGIIADQLYKTADDIQKINDEMEKQQEMLKKKYQRMQDAVKEQLDSQLAALKSQYELGLISREQYEKQAEKYASEADEKIYAIEKEMNQKLEAIKNNTKDIDDSTEKTSEEATKTSSKLGDINLNFGNITEAINRINDLIISTTTQMIQGITSSFTRVTSALTTSITSTISGVTSSITSLNSAITDSIVKIIEAITKLTTGLIPGFGGGGGGLPGLPELPELPGLPGINDDPTDTGGDSGGIISGLPGIGGIIDTVTDGIANSDPVQVGVGVLTGGLIDTHDSVGDNIANVLTGGLWGGIKNLFGWDVGSWSIPEDQMAVVHQGEIIVPRTFSEGIRRGELSLSSNGNVSKSESPLYVTVNVAGSVVTENQLIDSVYNGIRKGINSKRYSPLGAA